MGLDTLREAIQPHLSRGQPIAVHINADTSWLFLIPYPTRELQDPARPKYFKLLVDPWLTGYNEEGLFTMVYAEQHAIQPSVQTIAELESILRGLEDKEGLLQEPSNLAKSSPIDAVLVWNDNGDHCNEKTLRQIHPSVPVIAPSLPFKKIKGLKHFDNANVHAMHLFTSCIPEGSARRRSFFGLSSGKPTSLDWRLATYPGLPQWLGLAYTLQPGDYPPLHTPAMIAFSANAGVARSESSSAGDASVQAIVYCPHGASPSALAPFHLAAPKLSFLAIMTGLHCVSLPSIPLQYGASGGLNMLRELHPRFWLATHDEVKEKTAKGLIPYVLRRKPNSVTDVAAMAEKSGFSGRVRRAGERRDDGDVTLLELGSGEVCVLGEP